MSLLKARSHRCVMLLALALLLLCLAPAAGASGSTAVTAAPDLVVFVREGCPHCQHAKDFLAELQAAHPELRIELRWVDRDPRQAEELVERSRRAGVWPPGVPSFLLGEELLVGFDGEGQRARELESRLLLGLAETSGAAAGLPTWASLERLGLPAFTLVLGLLDGFNPCAMWVLLFLLSLLARMDDRRRMALVAGTFVLVSGLVYYAFMAAWLNLFLLVGFGTTVRLTLAGIALLFAGLNLKDALIGLRGPSLSIPQAAKPGIYARVRALLSAPGLVSSLVGVAALAVLVNTVELLCTAGLPALYTAVLTQQVDSSGLRYAYLALYIVGYMADDALMVGLALGALGARRLSERAGRALKLLSGLVMLVLALVLLLRPDWLL